MTDSEEVTHMNSDVIADIEDLLERARRGEVLGFAVAYATPSGEARSTYCSGSANCHVLNSGVDLLKWRLSNIIHDEMTDVEELDPGEKPPALAHVDAEVDAPIQIGRNKGNEA